MNSLKICGIEYSKELFSPIVREFSYGIYYCLTNEKWDMAIQEFLHREDGPAIIYPDGRQKWYYMGEEINCTSQVEFERLLRLKAFW